MIVIDGLARRRTLWPYYRATEDIIAGLSCLSLMDLTLVFLRWRCDCVNEASRHGAISRSEHCSDNVP